MRSRRFPRQPIENRTNWRHIARHIASCYDITLDDDNIEFLLWERTAFPMADPACIERQLAAAIREIAIRETMLADAWDEWYGEAVNA